jgi:hypothetical protein
MPMQEFLFLRKEDTKIWKKKEQHVRFFIRTKPFMMFINAIGKRDFCKKYNEKFVKGLILGPTDLKCTSSNIVVYRGQF